MAQKDKKLLLKDLVARLPYGVICKRYENAYELVDIDIKRGLVYLLRGEQYVPYSIISDDEIKPYLRPMSSMTEEERKELVALCGIDYINEKVVDFGEFLCESSPINIKNIYGLLDWLNKYHFDYRGLIEKNLALNCTGLHIYD